MIVIVVAANDNGHDDDGGGNNNGNEVHAGRGGDNYGKGDELMIFEIF